MFNTVKTTIKAFWNIIRRLSGDDAYEQYLKHYAEAHDTNNEDAPVLLSRAAFFKEWQDKKWQGIKRCC